MGDAGAGSGLSGAWLTGGVMELIQDELEILVGVLLSEACEYLL